MKIIIDKLSNETEYPKQTHRYMKTRFMTEAIMQTNGEIMDFSIDSTGIIGYLQGEK